MSDQKHTVSTVAALVAGGAVIGAGLGLLFAPKAGADTRRDVSRYAKKLNCKRLDGVGLSNPA